MTSNGLEQILVWNDKKHPPITVTAVVETQRVPYRGYKKKIRSFILKCPFQRSAFIFSQWPEFYCIIYNATFYNDTFCFHNVMTEVLSLPSYFSANRTSPCLSDTPFTLDRKKPQTPYHIWLLSLMWMCVNTLLCSSHWCLLSPPQISCDENTGVHTAQ